MTKKDFLKKLRSALENNLCAEAISENLEYYGSYIESEIQSGRPECEVIAGLGDPWAIARTIIETEKRCGRGGYAYTDDVGRSGDVRADGALSGGSSSQIRRLLTIALVIVVIVTVISTVLGLVVSLLPVILPVIIAISVFRFFFGRS